MKSELITRLMHMPVLSTYCLFGCCTYDVFGKSACLASCHCPSNLSSPSVVLTHFELRRLALMLVRQHRVQDAERVLNPEDRAVAPGCSQNHQPAEASLRGHEPGSGTVLLRVNARL